MKQRVVVTGFGSVSPLGLNTSELWQQMVRGASGLRFITSFDASLFPVKVVGEIRIFLLTLTARSRAPINSCSLRDAKPSSTQGWRVCPPPASAAFTAGEPATGQTWPA